MKVYLIVDRSGSMLQAQDATISGINEYVSGLKSGDVSLTLFDTQVETKPVVKVKNFTPLNRRTYKPNGRTALYDAVCHTLQGAEENTGKNLVVVMTDGEENASSEYNEDDMKLMIERLDKKNWSFVYLGANQDAFAVAGRYGFQRSNIASYRITDASIHNLYSKMAESTKKFAASEDMETAEYFSPQQQQAIEEAK